MEYRNIPNIVLKDVDARQMMYRNFAGNEGRFNPAGRRSFTLRFNPDPKVDGPLVEQLKADGWNIRDKETRDGDPMCQLQVFVDFSKAKFMPNIKMYRNSDMRGVRITESNADLLDSSEIVSFDVSIRPYQWETAPGTSGVKAYVKSMNVVIEYDEIADRYEHGVAEDDEELPFL